MNSDLRSSGGTTTASPPHDTALSTRGIRVSYGHVHALRGADFDCRAGEVTALIGDNGAGKSTLVKVLSGALAPDDGQVYVGGEPFRANGPTDAQAAGIETVWQDLALAPDMGPVANMFLGRETRRKGLLGAFGFLDNKSMAAAAQREFAQLGVTADPRRGSVSDMSGGQRQGVAVARAVSWARTVVLLDEPTAALGVVQTKGVLDMVRRVADRGLAVVLISHNMSDVLSVADRIEVLRLGQRVASYSRQEASLELLVSTMTGGSASSAPTDTENRGDR
ncbi:ATP-binding cassette domain-containing protein [Microbacterium sp. K24]|jgi:simple sugar transport system ATP-binding protein|uniref:ATP-binding cassette domain-containing protein n=1 Tax=Microbacterium sp. K24 TaxID=2305446 RepID=UPI00109CC1EF|nr:ATP-binding cassette domain-containing protein [Microbacterium sp. K24]